MKRIIILFLLLSLILCGCNLKTQQPVQPNDQPLEDPTQALVQKKILLELQQFDLEEASYEGEEAETEEISILLEKLSLPETELKPYENDDFLTPITAALEDELGLILDEGWKFYIHYYTPEQNVGLLSMTYWVDDIIATNRAVTILIEKRQCSYHHLLLFG